MTAVLRALDFVPGWLYAVVLGIAVVLCVSLKLQVDELRTNFAEYRATAAEAQRTAEAQQREIERRWADRITEVSTHAESEKNALAADLAASRDAADGLRAAASAAARRACPSAPVAAAGPGEPDSSAIDLLVGVLGRADAAAGEMAEYADRLGIAGAACESSYEALTP